MAALLPLLLAAFTGYCVVRVSFAHVPGFSLWRMLLVEPSLGTLLGFGLYSALFFLGRWAGSPDGVVRAVELILPVAIIAVFWRRMLPHKPDGVASRFRWAWIIGAVLLLSVAAYGAWFSKVIEMNPHGNWDAWSMWNTRAKFLVDGGTWREAVSPALERIHPDYPLMLPALVARSWVYAGEQDMAAPVAISVLFALAALGTLVGALAMVRSPASGLLGGLLLLAGTMYLGEIPALYADVPLSAFLLAAVVLAVWGSGSAHAGLLFAGAGVFASMAAWTKTEGLLFIPVLLFAAIAIGPRPALVGRIRSACWILAGAVPGIALVVAYRVALAPGLDAYSKQPLGSALGKIVDVSRYWPILKAFGTEIINFAPLYTHPVLLIAILWFALRFVADPARRDQAALAGAVSVLMVAADFGAFVVSPFDLQWHLSTALSRLLVQIWPVLVLTVLLALRTPDESVPVEEESRPKKGSKRRDIVAKPL